MKTMTHPKTAKMTTELVCPCGKRLEVSVESNGWFDALSAVALANRWKLEDNFDFRISEQTPAYCPYCHDTHS